MIALWIVVAVIAIALIVLTHELGHYLAARAVGIKVEQFSIGFGPEIIGWDRGGTRYSIKWILAGGSVKILGMDPDENIPFDELPHSYSHAAYWKRTVVVLAGSLVHLILAFTLFFIVFWPLGINLPVSELSEIGSGSSDSSKHQDYYRARLREGSAITRVNRKDVTSWEETASSLDQNIGSPVDLVVEDQGLELIFTAENVERDPTGYILVLGVDELVHLQTNPGTALWEATKLTGETSASIFKSIGSLFSLETIKVLIGTQARDQDSPRSVVGVTRTAFHVTDMGVDKLLVLLAQLLIYIAFFNLIPLPPFDGGHLLVIVVEKIFHRKVNLKRIAPVAWVVIGILTVVALRLAWLDIFSPIP